MTDQKKPKLLVVEDDEGLQRQLRWAYEGYDVLVAGDRASAIDVLRAEEPAVVTLDLGLPPDPDGLAPGRGAEGARCAAFFPVVPCARLCRSGKVGQGSPMNPR